MFLIILLAFALHAQKSRKDAGFMLAADAVDTVDVVSCVQSLARPLILF